VTAPRVDWRFFYAFAVATVLVYAGATWRVLAACGLVGLWLDVAFVLIHRHRQHWRERWRQ
jgi:cell division protein FtsW (lipid II flippase)